MIGGYKIIDLKGVDIYGGGAGVTVDGLYDRIEEAQKPILLEGLVINSVEYKPCFVTFNVSSTNFVGVLHTVYGTETATATILTVKDTDKIVPSTIVVHGTAPTE